MPIGPGTRVGPYDITSLLGEGGMGQVYRATDTNLKRIVAIKVLPEAVASDAERLARFQREAEVLASLNHPNIAQIYGLERSAGQTALVMELVEGPTLADLIEQASGSRLQASVASQRDSGQSLKPEAQSLKPSRGIAVPDALAIARQIAEALEAAHERGIIHRDLKPANVKVRPDGTVKVLDFGLAKAMDPGGAASISASMSPTITSPAMTMAGMILGTAAYMSPEQAKGRAVDARADIWAFGAVLYEMLSGRRPFDPSTSSGSSRESSRDDGDDIHEVLAAVLRADPDWDALPASVPPRVCQVIQRCLRKNVKERFAHIQDVRLALDGAFETTSAPTTSAPVVVAAPLRLWQRPVPIAVAVLASAGIAGVAVWALTPPPVRPVTTFVASTSPDGVFFGQTGNHDVAISPDGTRVVYTAGPAPTRSLFVRPIDRLDGTANLGGLGPSDTPFFSPDGAWVGFASQNDQSWKKVSILGGPPVRLWASSSAPRGASWGPDNTIVFAQSQAGTGLFRGPSAGGEPSVLTTPDRTKGEINHAWPEFLPDGQALLFTVVKGGRDQDREVAILDLATGIHRTLIPGGTNPRDNVSTGHIVYGAQNTLRAVAFDLSRLAVTGDPVPVLADVMIKPSGAAVFSVSASGSLAYAAGNAVADVRRSLVWVDRQGREEPVPADAGNYQEFSLSPDGTRVAVRVVTVDGENDVFVLDLTRSTSTRLTFDSGVELYPTWTPDGLRVAFGSPERPLSWKAADGTGTADAIGEVGELPNGFSPDGAAIVYESRTAASDVGVRWIKGDCPSGLVVESEFVARNASLSRDGRWLAYESNESGTFEVFVRPFPDVNAGRWQVSQGGGYWPVWSPASNELFYRGRTGVMVQAFDTEPTFTPRARTPLFDWPASTGATNRRMAVSPDGKRLLLLKEPEVESGAEDTRQIVVIENWTEQLKRLTSQ